LNIKDFPDKLHREIKIQAAIENTTIKGLIERVMTEYLKEKGGV